MGGRSAARFGGPDNRRGGRGSIDTDRIRNPIVGFIFDNKGLMYNSTFDGTKISRICIGEVSAHGSVWEIAGLARHFRALKPSSYTAVNLEISTPR
jgi:hypothetical protein